ncbi:MAG: metal ABC transporter permease, partial [Peptococcales bacterium]
MEFLNYAFMQRALLAGTIIGIICPLVGSFLILKRLSMIGDALAHISMSGIALGLIIGTNPTFTALITASLASLLIDFLRKNFKKYDELSIAIIMAAGLGLGIVLISIGGSSTSNVMSYLFGSIIAISTLDLVVISLVALFVFSITILLYNKLFFLTFDEEAAKIRGMRVETINILFLLLTSMTIVVSIKITGILLTSALITLPVACGLQLGKSFRNTTLLSIFFAE